MSERCGYCRYFREETCHRFPPLVVGDTYTFVRDFGDDAGTETSFATRWPVVDADEWCGEFVASDDAPRG